MNGIMIDILSASQRQQVKRKDMLFIESQAKISKELMLMYIEGIMSFIYFEKLLYDEWLASIFLLYHKRKRLEIKSLAL